MGNILTGSEIVELGIRIENNGRDFYNSLSGQAENLKVQKTFKFLAGEEEKHIKTFQGILDQTQRFEPQGLDADQYLRYVSAYAGEYIFTQRSKGEMIAKSIKNDKEALAAAIRFEEGSIVFYSGMKRVVPEYDVKIVEALIRQEEGHLMQLLDMKKLI